MLCATELQNALYREMADSVSGLGGAHVLDLSDGSEIFQYDHLTSRVMASITKMFTAGAALQYLGSETTFSTRLFASQLPDAEGSLHSDLYVVGGGDPTLGNAEHVESTYYGQGTSGRRIVEAIWDAGIRHIKGGVVGDSSLFDTASSEAMPHVVALTYNRNREGEPARFAAHKIRTALIEAGVWVDGSASQRSAPIERMYEVGAVQSPTVQSLLIKAGHDSDNFVAETITKLLAVQCDAETPSTEAGATKVERFATETGAAIEIANGSGLGLANKCSPAVITSYLAAMDASDHATAFEQTLPQAGDQGTLKDRMRNTWAATAVRAKTGTLTRDKKPFQDSLAGYCRGPRGAVAFSFVLEAAESRYAARASIDRMTDALAAYCCQPKRAVLRSWFR